MTQLGHLQTGRLALLPADVLLRIFVLTEFYETGRLAMVCRSFRNIAPIALYLQLHNEGRVELEMELRESGRPTAPRMQLRAARFDTHSKVVEFHCSTRRNGSTEAAPATDNMAVGTRYTVRFRAWTEPLVLTDCAENHQGGMDGTARKMFHDRYHPFAETTYRCRPGYTGDRHVIARWEKVQPEQPSISQSETQVAQPRCRLVWLRVSLAYIMAGHARQPTLPRPSYEFRWRAFNDARVARGLSTIYNAQDQQLLAWLAGESSEQQHSDHPLSGLDRLVVQVSGAWSQRQQVEAELVRRAVDPLSLWKYGFAKRFVTEDELASIGSSGWTVKSVVERIVAAEAAEVTLSTIDDNDVGLARMLGQTGSAIAAFMRNSLAPW